MDVIKGIYENLFSYKHVEIPFNELNFTLFKGVNASGKSSLFDILCWIIYGSTARKKYKGILRDVPDKPKSGKGVVWIKMDDGNVYRIERKAGRGKGLSIFNGDDEKPISFRTNDMVSKYVEQLLGMNMKTFLNIAYFTQGDVGRFLTSESSERIQIVADILDLAHLDKVKELVDKDIKTMSYDIENYKGQMLSLTEDVNNTNIKKLQSIKKMNIAGINKVVDDLVIVSQYLDALRDKNSLTNKISELKETYNTHLEHHKNTLLKIKSSIQNLRLKKDNSPELNEKIRMFSEKLVGVNEINKKYSILKAEIDELNKKSNKAESKIEYLVADKKIFQSVYELEGTECPTCHNEVTKKNLQHISNRIAEIDANIDLYKKRYDKIQSMLRNKLIARDELERKLSELNSINGQMVDCKNKLKEIKQRSETIKDYQKQYNDYKASGVEQLESIKNKISNVRDDLSYYKEFDLNHMVKYTEKYSQLEQKRLDIEKDTSVLKVQIQRYYDNVKKIKALEESKKHIEDDYKIKHFWSSALPKIKVKMISEVIPFIEIETNKYLSQILPGKMMSFIIDPDKVTNKLDVNINDYENGVERTYEGWSGGERNKMSISVYLALNKLASIRSGKQVNFLILDEKFSSIDSESRLILLEMLRSEYAGRKIWAISHVKDIDNEFEEVVHVQKKNNISTLQIQKMIA